MKLHLLYFAVALSAATYGAQITLAPAPDGLSADVVIDGLAGFQVGAYDISIDYDTSIVLVTAAQSLGFLGVPGVETLRQVQISSIGPSMERVQVSEISLLPSPDLLALQPGNFGLIRLSLQWHGLGATSFAISGLISDAVGDPILTTFANGSATNIPEPGTLYLLAIAGVILLLRARLHAGQ